MLTCILLTSGISKKDSYDQNYLIYNYLFLLYDNDFNLIFQKILGRSLKMSPIMDTTLDFHMGYDYEVSNLRS